MRGHGPRPGTGAQRLRYDGSPTPDGATISCGPRRLTYDTRADRVLVIEYRGASCAGHVFAVDADAGALTLVSVPDPLP
jgi:hypothetical protein